MPRRILSVVFILAALAIMVFGGFFLAPAGASAGVFVLILGLACFGIGAALLGPRPRSAEKRE